MEKKVSSCMHGMGVFKVFFLKPARYTNCTLNDLTFLPLSSIFPEDSINGKMRSSTSIQFHKCHKMSM